MLPNENIPPPAAGAAGASGAALALAPNKPPLDDGRPVDVLCSAGFAGCPNNPPPVVFPVAAVVPNILPPAAGAAGAGAAGLAPNKPPPDGATGGVEAGVVD